MSDAEGMLADLRSSMEEIDRSLRHSAGLLAAGLAEVESGRTPREHLARRGGDAVTHQQEQGGGCGVIDVHRPQPSHSACPARR